MKMQIWKIYVSDGLMDAIHGGSHAVYEGLVPELKLTVNQVTSFVNDDCSRYEEPNHQLTPTPLPELVCEVELSRDQIEDVRLLAGEDNPEDRIRQLIATTLKDKSLDASNYEKSDDEES